MKYRQGFVSNSSSTSFVVAVPREFVPTEEQIKSFVREYNSWYTDAPISDPQKALDMINEIVNNLCEDGFLYELSGKEEVFINVFPEMYLTSIEGGPGENSCINILSDEKRKESMAMMKNLVEKYNEV
jgi:hypothetical protein